MAAPAKKHAARKTSAPGKKASATAASNSTASASPAPLYFRPEALKFLRSLKRNNRREWFQPRKEIFDREIRAPMLAIANAVTHAMMDFAPAHMRPAEKVVMRIYRDTRFSSDKSPYKRQLGAWWSREGLEKTSGGGFYFHIAPDEFVIAAGVYMPEREQLLAIRRFLLEHHAEARRLLHDRKLKGALQAFEGLPLTRPPKGFPADHPAMDLILCRQWGLSAHLPADIALEPRLVGEIVSRFRLAAPLIELLNTPLVTQLARRKRPLFGLY
jgi:uncharacterized protein (TIGR02453 family)